MRLAILDNRDSFLWNIVHLAHAGGADVQVFDRFGSRVDKARPTAPAPATTPTLATIQAWSPDALIVGPGPGHPDAATLSFDVFRAFPDKPVLGICLGHQVLARLHGGAVGRSQELGHGRPLEVHHDAAGLFAGLHTPCTAGRYHSLCVTAAPGTLTVTARSPGGEILGLQDPARPHMSVQFHPESQLSDCGPALLANFCALA